MAATTLSSSISQDSLSTAIIIPSNPALTISYKQLSADVRQLQIQLAKLGIGHGDAVSIALPNTYEFIVSFLATARQRAIAAPLNPAYKQDEFEFYIDDLSSSVVLVPRGAYGRTDPSIRAARKYNATIAECYLEGSKVVLEVKEIGKKRSAQQILQPQPEDTALVLHTSGTTGRPKAVPLSHRNLTQTMLNVQHTYELGPSDRTYLVMPLFHVHGLLAGLLAPLKTGGSVIVPPRFSAKAFWDDFVTHQANWYTAVPTIHAILVKNGPPMNIPSIRFIRSCSAALPPKVMRELESMCNCPVLEAYAMTEAAHQMCSNPLPHRGHRKAGSVGLGQGVEIAILDAQGNEAPQGDQGEVCIRGDNVTKGYINNDKANRESFTAQGFFRTGDQGYKDTDGYIILTGRIKELIIRGGEKISPIELDNVIGTLSSISEAVSFGVPSDILGQEVGVAVVPKSGQTVEAKDVINFVESKLAAHKKPSKVCIVPCLYLTPRLMFPRYGFSERFPKQPLAKSSGGKSPIHSSRGTPRQSFSVVISVHSVPIHFTTTCTHTA
jgi:oxalate---CoA ligase